MTPGNATDPALPPLAAFGQQADFQAALHGAVATMGALFARRRTGRGQLVEVSAQECIAAALELALVTYTYSGAVASRLGVSSAGIMQGIMQCKDGLIYVLTPQEHQWDAFVELMGNPDWAELEIFKDRLSRGQNADALRPLVEGMAAGAHRRGRIPTLSRSAPAVRARFADWRPAEVASPQGAWVLRDRAASRRRRGRHAWEAVQPPSHPLGTAQAGADARRTQ